MIYVTHDRIEAMTLADRIAILRDGRTQQLGIPDEIHNRPRTRYVAEFIGSPTMNFLSGTVEGDECRAGDLRVGIEGCSWAEEAAEGGVWLGIQPEHVLTGVAAARMPFSTEIEEEIFEPMGSHALAWTSIFGQSLHFCLDGQIRIVNGDRMAVGQDMVRGSVFDRPTKAKL